jgi:hypothetical protein
LGQPPPLPATLWTVEEEAELLELKSNVVNLADTALAVATSQMGRAVGLNAAFLDRKERLELKRALQAIEDLDEEDQGINFDQVI